MNCIFLLLLLSCCGGFGSDGSRSGNHYGCNGNTAYSDNNGCGCGTTPLTNGNNIGNTFPTLGNGCGYQDVSPRSGNNGDCGCGENNQGTRNVLDGNPSNWQDYPEISHRDNCDCDN